MIAIYNRAVSEIYIYRHLGEESRFFQREAKLLENSFSKAAANESKLLVQVTRNATDSVHAVEEQVEKRIQGALRAETAWNGFKTA